MITPGSFTPRSCPMSARRPPQGSWPVPPHPPTPHRPPRPYRPQTNGKVERFHRTLASEWAYARPYTSETERRAALDPWLHTYNHHRGHTALKGLPPASRVPTLSGQNT